jgi:hypothetical protein
MSEERDQSQDIFPERIGDEAIEIAVQSGGDEPEGHLEVPEVLPVLPLKNTVIFPSLLAPLMVNTPRSIRLIDHVLLTRERMFVTAAVRHAVEGSPGADDIYDFGTIVRVARMLKFPDGSYRLLIQGVSRVRIAQFVEGVETGLPPGEKPLRRRVGGGSSARAQRERAVLGTGGGESPPLRRAPGACVQPG